MKELLQFIAGYWGGAVIGFLIAYLATELVQLLQSREKVSRKERLEERERVRERDRAWHNMEQTFQELQKQRELRNDSFQAAKFAELSEIASTLRRTEK